MQAVQSLTFRFLFVIILILLSISTIPQFVSAGTPGQEAIFTLSNLVISPAEVTTGQTITISATIEETNNISGLYEGTLKINDAIEEQKTLMVGPNATQEITFTTAQNVAGVYTVDLDGLVGTFTVTGEPVADSSDSTFPTVPVVIAIVAAIVIIGLSIFYWNRKRAT
ncbi:MAG: hypothetical protein JSV32_03785 [Dehalococcoidia bacterium]|nr:MAG: hypothetical protein JSV32_03785 [Dehalococcoidia bacterium]